MTLIETDFTVRPLATSGPPESWQDHHISRTGGPMVHCLVALEMLISSPAQCQCDCVSDSDSECH